MCLIADCRSVTGLERLIMKRNDSSQNLQRRMANCLRTLEVIRLTPPPNGRNRPS
jgi:hypothetical protein